VDTFNEFDILFPGAGKFHVCADYDAKTCTVTPDGGNDKAVVTAPNAEVSFADAVMTPSVRFFVKEIGVYCKNHC